MGWADRMGSGGGRWRLRSKKRGKGQAWRRQDPRDRDEGRWGEALGERERLVEVVRVEFAEAE